MVLNKKFVVLIAFFSLLLCIITLQDTYAKYTSKADGTTDIAIARWRILVNNFDVRESLTSDTLITPVFSGSTHIAPDIIAPTSIGYFDIVIDASDTDVSFDYSVTTSIDETSSISDLLITGYQLDGGTTVNVTTDEEIIGTINYNDVNRTQTIRVFVTWNDATGTMDNAQDTNTTLSSENLAKLNVSVHFIQKIA